MNKKFLGLMAALIVLGSTSVFAFGIGAQLGYTAGGNSTGAAVTFKLDSVPWVFAVDVGGIGSNYMSFGLTADMWLANKTFAKPFGYFYGWGLAGSFAGSGDSAYLFLGGRVYLGVNAFFAKVFELYAQVAWQPGISFYFSDNGGISPVIASFPLNLGFRLWL